jgi:hypothetical protein
MQIKLVIPGKPIDWEWFDESRLELVKKPASLNEDRRGGPFPNAPQS